MSFKTSLKMEKRVSSTSGVSTHSLLVLAEWVELVGWVELVRWVGLAGMGGAS